jgi:hypothetical protein
MQEGQNMTRKRGLPVQDGQPEGRTSRQGLNGQDRTSRIGHLGQDIQDKKHLEQDSQTVQPEQDSQFWTGRTGQPGEDSQNVIDRT